MELLVVIPLVLTLGVISYQDLRSGSILWILFPAGIALCMMHGLIQMSATEYFRLIVSNMIFILLILVVPLGLYRLKSGTFSAVFDRYIGLGDILMFFLLCFSFSTINLVLFVVAGLLLILLVFGVLYLLKIGTGTVPLAGSYALMGMAALIIDTAGLTHGLFNDELGFRITAAIVGML